MLLDIGRISFSIFYEEIKNLKLETWNLKYVILSVLSFLSFLSVLSTLLLAILSQSPKDVREIRLEWFEIY